MFSFPPDFHERNICNGFIYNPLLLLFLDEISRFWHSYLRKGCVTFNCSPVVHPIINNWINYRVWHGKPVETQIYVLYIGTGHYASIVIKKYEKSMVGQPAYSKYCHDNYEHFYYLKKVLNNCVDLKKK